MFLAACLAWRVDGSYHHGTNSPRGQGDQTLLSTSTQPSGEPNGEGGTAASPIVHSAPQRLDYNRPLPLKPGERHDNAIHRLIVRRDPRVGRYRLSPAEMSLLWALLLAELYKEGDPRKWDPAFVTYFESVVRDMMRQPDFNAFFAEEQNDPVTHAPTVMPQLLQYSTTSLPFDMIDLMKPKISQDDVFAAVRSGRLEVLQQLCAKIIEKHLATSYDFPIVKESIQRWMTLRKDSASQQWNAYITKVLPELDPCGSALGM